MTTKDELTMFPPIESCRRNVVTCSFLAAIAQSEEGKSSWLAMADFWQGRGQAAKRGMQNIRPAQRAAGTPTETYTLSA